MSVSASEGHQPPCPECGSKCAYTYVPALTQIVLKDGPSGSWPSKGERFKKYRAKQAELAEKRQNDRYGSVNKLVPNYNGQECSSWTEAREEALKDRGLESAATYDTKVREEKAVKLT